MMFITPIPPINSPTLGMATINMKISPLIRAELLDVAFRSLNSEIVRLIVVDLAPSANRCRISSTAC
jgi:hypothetical protein